MLLLSGAPCVVQIVLSLFLHEKSVVPLCIVAM